MHGLRKVAIFRKFEIFRYILTLLSQWHSYLALSIKNNIKSLHNLQSTKPQANKLAIPLQTHGTENRPVLSFATKYQYRATYHLNVEAISFAIW